jgi:hypothetical protein
MTETIKTDELARNAAYNAIRLEHVDATGPHGDGLRDCERMARYVVDSHTVTWERDANENGVPVRRYVLRGAWEVDPEPRAVRIQKGDVVRYDDIEFGPHDDWIVTSVPFKTLEPGLSIVLVRRPEWINDEYVNTSERMVTLIRRPGAISPEVSRRAGR